MWFNFYLMTRRLLALGGLCIAALIWFAAMPQNNPKPNPTEAARLNNLGAAYMNQQLFEKGLKAFQQASALDPQLEVAKMNQGVALLNLGRIEEATKILEDAGKRNPKDPHAWYSLGLLYKNSSSSQAAIDAFRHVTELDPNDADVWYFLGNSYSQAKQFAQAIDAFQHALKLNPLHASAEFGLSRAYQQSGDVEHAREHLKRFQYITQNKLGSPISLAYGEQGQYSRVEESPGAVEKAAPAIPVKFVAVTTEAGLAGTPSPDAGSGLASYFGPGACFFDYDGDGRPDIFLADNGPAGGLALYHNLGSGKYEDVTKKAGLDSSLHGIGCSAGDYDNDGVTDLAVTLDGKLLLLHGEKGGTFKDVTQTAGVETAGFDLSPVFVDYDHDGDLDLLVTQYTNNPIFDIRKTGARSDGEHRLPSLNRMWRNNGNGTFTDQTEAIGIGVPIPTVGAVGSDYNNDRAVDLVVTGFYKSTTIFENPRERKFKTAVPQSTEGLPTVGMAVLDADHDGWMDFAYTHPEAPGISLWRNQKAKNFDEIPLPKTNWVRGWGVAALDYDNDGWVDLVAAGETANGTGEVRLFRNLGPDGFKDVSAEVGLDRVALKAPRSVVTGDFDGDGGTDLLITQNHGSAVLLKNQGGNKNNWLRLNLKGLNDNKSGIGAKVEIFAGASRQKFEIAGSSGFLGENSTAINVGLGKAKEADVVRMLWPTGVLQDEVEVAGLKQQDYLELDRRGSSCPTLFVWNGQHYVLVGDMIGAGVVGHWVAPAERNIPRPTEYLKVDRASVQQKDGRLSFRIMEPMEEVVYLDQVKLLAVDHPASFDVYPNEYFASNPPYPAFKVVVSKTTRIPAGVWDEHRHNQLPSLLAHRYIGDFELLPFKGFTQPHTLELDLGQPYRGGPLWLLMHGEIEYFTATAMYAADQAGIKPIAPYVEALNSKGKWVRVMDDMGFPAGGPRTMTADLTGRLPQGTQRIRISTNLQIYWDSILIDRTPQDQKVRLTPLAPQQASLAFHGYPRQIEARPPGVVKYVYEQVSRTGPYARQAGTYTRYGDVTPLLAGFDDRFAVFGSGEEVAMEFDPSSLPSLPEGWVRDYFFMANGYEKDMDFYAADGSTVEPLPFRGMGTYPYPDGKSFPLDDAHLDYLLNFNTRHVSGNEPHGYRFNYGPQK